MKRIIVLVTLVCFIFAFKANAQDVVSEYAKAVANANANASANAYQSDVFHRFGNDIELRIRCENPKYLDCYNVEIRYPGLGLFKGLMRLPEGVSSTEELCSLENLPYSCVLNGEFVYENSQLGSSWCYCMPFSAWPMILKPDIIAGRWEEVDDRTYKYSDLQIRSMINQSKNATQSSDLMTYLNSRKYTFNSNNTGTFYAEIETSGYVPQQGGRAKNEYGEYCNYSNIGGYYFSTKGTVSINFQWSVDRENATIRLTYTGMSTNVKSKPELNSNGTDPEYFKLWSQQVLASFRGAKDVILAENISRKLLAEFKNVSMGDRLILTLHKNTIVLLDTGVPFENINSMFKLLSPVINLSRIE